MSVSESIKASKQKYERKRSELPQFPRQYISDSDELKIQELLKIYGTKKAVLLAAIDELYKSKINSWLRAHEYYNYIIKYARE